MGDNIVSTPRTNGQLKPNDDEQGATPHEVQTAIFKFTHAVERRMKPALDAAIRHRDDAFAKLAQLKQVEQALCIISTAPADDSAPPQASPLEKVEKAPSVQTRVNIGEHFYVRAHVYQSEPVILDVGLGVLVEMTNQEATDFVRHKTTLLKQSADAHSARISTIRAQLQQIVSNLSQLKSNTSISDFMENVSNLHLQC